ncbi:MAG: ABC transporter permease, partial [Gemmatimonadetes bacterium]|nr:ABC transporter permease [Gemmatimonadota bacterium]
MSGPRTGSTVGRVAALVRKEMRQLFRDPKTKRIIFVSPIIQLLLFGYAVNTDVRQVPTQVVDHDRTAVSRSLIEAMTASDYFRVVGTSDDPGTIGEALDRGDAVVGLRIPPGFAADVAGGRTGRVQILVDGSNSNTATVAQGYAQRIVNRFAQRTAEDRGLLPTGGIDLRARAWPNPSLESRVY